MANDHRTRNAYNFANTPLKAAQQPLASARIIHRLFFPVLAGVSTGPVLSGSPLGRGRCSTSSSISFASPSWLGIGDWTLRLFTPGSPVEDDVALVDVVETPVGSFDVVEGISMDTIGRLVRMDMPDSGKGRGVVCPWPAKTE